MKINEQSMSLAPYLLHKWRHYQASAELPLDKNIDVHSDLEDKDDYSLHLVESSLLILEKCVEF